MKRLLQRLIDWLRGKVEKVEPDPVPEPVGWRDGRDVGVIAASDNAVEFWTRDVLPAPGPNRPGDAEWIIARIEGSGYRRLLIMVMWGPRPPSRIYFQTGAGATFENSRFSVPLPGPSRWRVEASGGALRVILDGREVWSARGGYGVTRAVMCDSAPRGFLGQWREG